MRSPDGWPRRRAAFAGSWYPGEPGSLASLVDGYLADVPPLDLPINALVAPHAGLMYSGPVAAWAYGAVRRRAYDVVVLVGPSHYAAFDGCVVAMHGAFDTPFGPLTIDEVVTSQLADHADLVRADPAIHAREHSLELQTPFLARLLPGVPIVPILMGDQSRDVVDGLSRVLPAALAGRRPLLVASSDLSHYHSARASAILDAVVVNHLARFDDEGLQRTLEARPEHACGGGPIVAVMKAARALGATGGQVLRRADSGDVSGDETRVVGYVAAAFGPFGIH